MRQGRALMMVHAKQCNWPRARPLRDATTESTASFLQSSHLNAQVTAIERYIFHIRCRERLSSHRFFENLSKHLRIWYSHSLGEKCQSHVWLMGECVSLVWSQKFERHFLLCTVCPILTEYLSLSLPNDNRSEKCSDLLAAGGPIHQLCIIAAQSLLLLSFTCLCHYSEERKEEEIVNL